MGKLEILEYHFLKKQRVFKSSLLDMSDNVLLKFLLEDCGDAA
jgi:hypothetical protein